jgi:hypothetical protein
MPLPEHPRPDFERSQWINLNGAWQFRFDPTDEGVSSDWPAGSVDFDKSILVPFSWGAPLSGVEDEADIGWYARAIEVPMEWREHRVFVVVGAADWHSTIWLDGTLVGEHRGGYTPFSLELTDFVTPGEPQRLVIRVDDTPQVFKLEGKQGYGPARGIWQTPYLEARGGTPLEDLQFAPDVAAGKVSVTARLLEPAPSTLTLDLRFRNGVAPVAHTFEKGSKEVRFDIPLPKARLWSLEDPYLYELDTTITGDGMVEDRVATYFGMRDISVVNLPGTDDHPYIALNGEPVYLQMSLDQAYHPEGFYTFPSDRFIRDEILRARQIGLNGQRIHVKVGIPRKLYWADRLGMLIMADVPNSWGEPDAEMRFEVEHALRQMIRRDYNHPSIFAWVPFNETWGLFTPSRGEERKYLPETQAWVSDIVALAKKLDPTRLVEDNSPCCGIGHVDTDINSWHWYLPGYGWKDALEQISADTYPGSKWNFEGGRVQEGQPNINSEFGNVWGYEGSAGDVDWSFDYHRAVNEFRRHPKIAGWLYTEHHDVINEWNGYWRFDRSEKFTGLEDFVEGMSLRDLHAPLYISTGQEIVREVEAGTTATVPLFASFMTSGAELGRSLTLSTRLRSIDTLGRERDTFEDDFEIPFQPWMQAELDPLHVPMPDAAGLAILELRLIDATGHIHHRNFVSFVVEGSIPEVVANARVLRFAPAEFTNAEWALKQWNVLDGLKVNGAGAGYFEYELAWPADIDVADVTVASLRIEVSAKQLFGKDRDDGEEVEGDFMRGRGTFDPSLNPNAYPMTDEETFPSAMTVYVNGTLAGTVELVDDPADHRGLLSWHAQPRDRRLREAGSYGYLVNVALPRSGIEAAAASGRIELKLAVPDSLPGGLAIYGARFGRYPLDPTIVFGLVGVEPDGSGCP